MVEHERLNCQVPSDRQLLRHYPMRSGLAGGGGRWHMQRCLVLDFHRPCAVPCCMLLGNVGGFERGARDGRLIPEMPDHAQQRA